MKTDVRLQRLTAISGSLKGRRVLEIGAGEGEFLAGARFAGASVVGNDVSPEACDFMESRLGIPVVRGDLSNGAQHIDGVDTVVLNNLLEHAIEPLRLFEAALGILNPNGTL